MNITITGNLGSGKTSVCRELAKFGFTIISAGDIFRQIAAEKGMTVIELNEAAKKDRSIDDMLDARSAQLGKEMDHAVFDSRLAWHFVENSFKVFLLVDTQEAARRVFAGDSRGAEEYRDMDAAREGLRARAELEKERFAKLYGLDYYDAANYDLIIESSCAAPQQIAQEIERSFQIYQDRPFSAKILMNIKSLYPGKRFGQLNPEKFQAYCREEKERAKTLSAADTVEIAEKGGCYYLLHGHHRVFAAASAGKVFAEVGRIRTDEDAKKALQPLTKDDILEYEHAGGFCYENYPSETAGTSGYMIQFPASETIL